MGDFQSPGAPQPYIRTEASRSRVLLRQRLFVPGRARKSTVLWRPVAQDSTLRVVYYR